MGFDRDLMDFFNGILMEISWAHRPLNDLMAMVGIPSGKLTVCNGKSPKSPFLMGKSTSSMAMASIAFCMFTRG